LPLDDRELNILIVRLSIIKSTVPLKD